MNTHLIIGDAHAKPDTDLSRFEHIGNLIASVKPDVVIDIGDFADMEALCSYDKGKKSFEGRRYERDIEVSIEARTMLMDPVRKLNLHNKKKKRKQYTPRWVATTGNHEHRISRVCEEHAELDGVISLEDLEREDMGWEAYPFLEPVVIDGLAYCHYFTSGVMGRAISGENPASMSIKKKFMSCVFGHTHLWDGPSVRTLPTGQQIMGLNVGCSFEHFEPYAGPANQMWTRCVTILRDVNNGVFDVEKISLKRLKEIYG